MRKRTFEYLTMELEEIHQAFIDAILERANESLSRLGISEPLQVVNRHKERVECCTAPIKQFPKLFKNIHIKCDITLIPEDLVPDTVSSQYFTCLKLSLWYGFQKFSGGGIGVELGDMIYGIDKAYLKNRKEQCSSHDVIHICCVQGLTI